MDGIPLHPAIVHIPIGVAFVVPIAAGIGAWLIWKKKGKMAWLVAAVLQAVVVTSGFIAMETGEDDEDLVEEIVGHDAIHEHEEAAELFVWLSVGILVGAAATLLAPGAIGRWLSIVTTAGAVAAIPFVITVGHLGGELVYVRGAANAHITTIVEPPTVIPVTTPAAPPPTPTPKPAPAP